MHWFYCTNISQQTAILDVIESGHCIRSLRHKTGDEVVLCDGRGNTCIAEITSDNAKSCELFIKSTNEPTVRSFQTHIAIAPTKQNERLEWFLEKATEIGIHKITPILCSNSERRKINFDRYQKILISALKQSQQPWLPEIQWLVNFNDFVKSPLSGEKFIAHCRIDDLPLLKNSISAGKNCVILIGPEGDFTAEEVDEAIKSGFTQISLGTSRLRTETAGIVAAQTIAFVNS